MPGIWWRDRQGIWWCDMQSICCHRLFSCVLWFCFNLTIVFVYFFHFTEFHQRPRSRGQFWTLIYRCGRWCLLIFSLPMPGFLFKVAIFFLITGSVPREFGRYFWHLNWLYTYGSSRERVCRRITMGAHPAFGHATVFWLLLLVQPCSLCQCGLRRRDRGSGIHDVVHGW